MHTVEVNKGHTDYVFYTSEGGYLHFEFQTTHKSDDLSRFLFYDAVLYYKDNRPIDTVVIYSSDIKSVVTQIDIGSIQYGVKPIYMVNYDGDEILKNIKSKVQRGDSLTQQDMMSLTFIPLMKSILPKHVQAIGSMEVVQELPESKEKLQCIAMLYAFIEKFGDEESKRKFKEVFTMTEVGRMILEEGREEGRQEGQELGQRHLLMTQLATKFKKITEADLEVLKKISMVKLNTIAINIFNIASLEELREYFE